MVIGVGVARRRKAAHANDSPEPSLQTGRGPATPDSVALRFVMTRRRTCGPGLSDAVDSVPARAAQELSGTGSGPGIGGSGVGGSGVSSRMSVSCPPRAWRKRLPEQPTDLGT
jgi:hypothetical protein